MPKINMVAVLFSPPLNLAFRGCLSVEPRYKVAVPGHDVEHFLVWNRRSVGLNWPFGIAAITCEDVGDM